MLDGLRGGHRHEQRARIRVADVLGREHDHAPRDEARVLAALEHCGEVIDARVGIRAAHRLDERGDEVVVRVGGLVVEQRPLPRGIVHVRLRERFAGRLRGLQGQLDDVVDGACVTAGASGDEPEQVVGNLGAQLRGAAARHRLELLHGQRLELVHLSSRQERGVDLEVGVLRRRADQRDHSLLDTGQERVLLRLVEAVDLVEEQDRALPVRAEPLARACENFPHLADGRRDG